jgi:hypothetical protein
MVIQVIVQNSLTFHHQEDRIEIGFHIPGKERIACDRINLESQGVRLRVG